MESTLLASGLGFPEGPAVLGDGRIVLCDGNTGELLAYADGAVSTFARTAWCRSVPASTSMHSASSRWNARAPFETAQDFLQHLFENVLATQPTARDVSGSDHDETQGSGQMGERCRRGLKASQAFVR